MIERFEPDGECRAVAIDFIIAYFNRPSLPKEKILQISSFDSILGLLKKQELNFVIKLHFLSFLSPEVWLIALKYFKHFSFTAKSFNNQKKILTESAKPHCIFYRLKAKQLYGVHESWTHCIVRFLDEHGDYKVYDPLKTEYGGNRIEYHDPSLDTAQSRAILIWDERGN